MAIQATFQDQLDEPFNIKFFVIGNNNIVNGVTNQHYISPYFATKDQAIAFKDDALSDYPECYCMAHEAYFGLELDSARLELLAKIVSGSFQQA